MSNKTDMSDKALNNLLDEVPGIAASPALHAKIMAAATGELQPSAQVIEFPQRTNVQKQKPSGGYNWLAGGFMAASLALGIWIGAAGVADTLISAPLEMAGLQSTDTSTTMSVDDLIDGLTISEGAL